MSKNLIIGGIVALVILIGVVVLLFKFSTPNPEVSDITVDKDKSATNSANTQELKIEDIKVGTGSAEVKSGDTISIHYLGTLENGTKFDSSYDRGQPLETQIGVGRVIQGWDQGVLGMKVGGKRKLTIPPDLGYGAQGVGNVIPPNSTLIFEVELVGIR